MSLFFVNVRFIFINVSLILLLLIIALPTGRQPLIINISFLIPMITKAG
jgi:hypothetical protein